MVEKWNKDVLEFCCHSHFLLWRDSWKDSRKGIFVNEIYFQLSVSKSVGPSRSRLLTLMLWVWSSGDITLRFKVLLSTYILNISSSPISPVSWSFLGLVFFPPPQRLNSDVSSHRSQQLLQSFFRSLLSVQTAHGNICFWKLRRILREEHRICPLRRRQ